MNEIPKKYIDSREVAEMKNPKCIYALLAKNGTVKIGVTKDFDRRKATIQKQSGKNSCLNLQLNFAVMHLK